MTAQGLPLTFGGNVGRYVEGTPLAFALDLDLPGASAVSAKGVVTGLGDVPALTADIRGEGRSLHALIAALPDRTAPRTVDALDHPFALTASLAATGEAIRLTDLTVELGGAKASGSANVAIGSTIRVDVALKADRIDADAILTPTAARSSTKEAGGSAGKEGADGGKAATAGVRFPDGIDVHVVLAVEEVLLKKRPIRQVRLDASLKDGGDLARRIVRRAARRRDPRCDGQGFQRRREVALRRPAILPSEPFSHAARLDGGGPVRHGGRPAGEGGRGRRRERRPVADPVRQRPDADRWLPA